MTVLVENQELTAEQKAFLTEGITLINVVLVAIKKQLMIVQHELTLMIGGPIRKAHLEIDHINELTGEIESIPAEGSQSETTAGLSAAEIELKLSELVEEKRTEIKDIKQVNIIIERALANTLTSGSVEISVAQFIVLVVTISTKITENKVDAEYSQAVLEIESDIRVPALSTTESTLLTDLEDLLMMLSVTTSVGMAEASEALIGARGLVVDSVDISLPFADQKSLLEAQLETNRANCENMDQVVQAITSLLESSDLRVVCNDMHDDDCEDALDNSQELFKQMVVMTQLVVEDIESPKISEEAVIILDLIQSITIVTREQRDVFISMRESIQGDVLVYVSQISILESTKLQIGGALTFPGATTTIDQVDESDFELITAVLTAQLTNLFQINDANERVIQCIEKIEGLPAPDNPTSNSELKKAIDQVPAMCSQASPPVEEVQQISANITRICQDITEQKTEADMKSISFIKNPLISFKQTFLSQISVFSQQLSAITGAAVNVASLGVTLISDSGELEVARPVDISGGAELGSQEFFVNRYQLMKSSLNSVEMVINKLSVVQSITEDGEEESGTISANDFSLLILKFASSLSSGAITSEIITIAQEVLQAKVTAAPSNAVLIILQSLMSTITSLQMTILTDIVVIKQQLNQVLVASGSSLSALSFVIQSFDSSGNLISVEEVGGPSSTDIAVLQSSLVVMEDSQKMLTSIQTFLDTTLSLDYSSLTVQPTVEVSLAEFMTKVSIFTLAMGKDLTDSSILSLGSELLDFKLTVISEAATTQLKFIISTVLSFSIQISTEVVEVRNKIGAALYTVNCPDFPEPLSEDDELTVTTLTVIRLLLAEVSESVEIVNNSTDTSASISAVSFFNNALQFFFELSSLDLAVISNGLSNSFQDRADKMIEDSKTGVTPASGKYKLIYDTIIQSVKIVRMIIQLQVDILCPPKPNPTIEKYKRLRGNEDALEKILSVILMIKNGTEFSTIPLSDCAVSLAPVLEGPSIPPCVDDTVKETSIITDLTSGMLTGLKSSLEDISIFSSVDSIVRAVFKHNFSLFTTEDIQTLDDHSTQFEGYLGDIKTEIQNLTDNLQSQGIDSSDIEHQLIALPPCLPPPMDPVEELKEKLTGLVSNLYGLESVSSAVQAVIAGPSGDETASVDDFLTTLKGLMAMMKLNSPCELHLSVIQEISSLLVVFSIQIQQGTVLQIQLLESYFSFITQYILDIILQINIIQAYLLQFTGATVDPLNLDITIIGVDGLIGSLQGPTIPTGPLLPSEEEEKIINVTQFLQLLLTKIDLVIIVIQQIISSTFVIDLSSSYTCKDLFSLVLSFLSLLMKGQFGDSLVQVEANLIIENILAITSLSAACGTEHVGFFKLILLVLTEVNINIIGGVVTLTQSLILSKGLIIKIDFEEISQKPLAEQISIFELSLEANRMNCEGMDRVALTLEQFLQTVTCSGDSKDDAGLDELIVQITSLATLGAANIEDETIVSLAVTILDLISTLTISGPVSSVQCKAMESIIFIIQNTVLTYVSQISIVEQKRLLLGGGLTFSISLNSSEIDTEDFQTRTKVEEAQLEGLMRCGDFTDRTRLSLDISQLSSVSLKPDPDCEGGVVAREARRVTAMCSSASLPLEEVATSTRQLARCSSSLSSPLTGRQISQIEFLLVSLGTFRITFTSQITLVQQRLTFLTGQPTTAASLGLSFIGPAGEDILAKPLDITAVNTDLIPVTDNKVEVTEANREGMELFLKKQWQEFRFAFSTLQIVMKCIDLVLSVSGVQEVEGGVFTSGTEFLQLVDHYFTKIGQGQFLVEELFYITFEIIRRANEVSVEVSGRIVLMLKSILMSLTSYQMACISEFIIIQQKLIQIG